jgi:hypothetical protein
MSISREVAFLNLEYKCMVYNCRRPGTIPFFMGDLSEKGKKIFSYDFLWICKYCIDDTFPFGADGCSYWRLG